jgi:hypothetical protein
MYGIQNPVGNPALAPVHSAPDSLARRLFITYELGPMDPVPKNIENPAFPEAVILPGEVSAWPDIVLPGQGAERR